MKIGENAPDFMLQDSDGNDWKLSEQKGKTVVLLFYPADETPVCTIQLCSVRDHWSEYQQTGAEVVGINLDTVEKHRRFAEHHDLPLRLLSDADGQAVKAYDMKNFLGVKRGIVVIDGAGVICFTRTVIPIFRPTDDEVLRAIRLAQKS